MSGPLEGTRVTRLEGTEAPQVISVLWESFYGYPVMRHVLRESGLSYAQHLQHLVALFVNARVLLDDVMLGIKHDDELIAVATTSNPATPPHPDFAALREQTWNTLGAEALARYQQFVRAWDEMATAVPQLHVNMIGVRRAFERRGMARALLHEIHQLALRSAAVTGVSLTTEDERNVSFYQRQGYEIIGHRRIQPDLQAWSFFRPNA